MFVCVVSLRARRIVIAGEVLEAASAADATNWFFPQLGAITEATAAAIDTVDAFKGQYLLEAASAADATNATLLTVFNRAIIEYANALDTVGGIVPRTVTGAMAEAASADAAQDATVTSLVWRSAMLPNAFVNSDGTLRQANVNGTMVNL